MFSWREGKRRRLRSRPLSADQWALLLERVPLVRRLPRIDREELVGHIQVLLAEKQIEGAGGLEITDDVKLIVFAQAGVLLLHRRDPRYFPRLGSVVVYPGEYVVRETVETDDLFETEVEESRVGESWALGTLVLSWEEVEVDLESERQNVVLHEFTHHLDAESGEMNGAPLFLDRALRRQWIDAMSPAFGRLAEAAQRGVGTLLDPYGAEDPSEFFAVAVEAFFLFPRGLSEDEPAVYDVLRRYFRQDPAMWPGETARLR